MAIAVGYFTSGDETFAATFSQDLRDGEVLGQKGTERIWRDAEWAEDLVIESTTETPLFGPFVVQEVEAGALLVLDSGDLSIKKFNARGDFVAHYGRGRGQGPGEFTGLSDQGMDQNGRVWAADPINGRITIFEADGELADTLRLPRPPYRLALQNEGDGNEFFMMNPPGAELFAHVTREGEELTSFGVLLENQGSNAITLDGWIQSAPGGGFVFGAQYVGLLIAYDAQGDSRFVAQTVDYASLPKLVRNGNQTWVDRDAAIPIVSLSVTSNSIHVLAIETDGLRRRGAIDTYSLDDGRYLYSRRLPESCRGIHISARYLYTIGDSTIRRWIAQAS